MSNKLNPHPDIPLDLPTGERLRAAIEHYGEEAVAQHAITLLRGKNAGKDFLLYAGGRHALGILDGAPALYWPELWGARTLLHVWSDAAAPYIVVGLNNQAWRIREMCAKVVLKQDLKVADKLVRLTTDENPRVRAAALHALSAQGTEANLPTIEQRLRDPEKEVRQAAQQSRDALKARLAASADATVGAPEAETAVDAAAEADAAQ